MNTTKGPSEETSIGRSPPPGSDTAPIDISQLIQSITSELELVMGRRDRVEADCARIRQALRATDAVSRARSLIPLLPLLRSTARVTTAPIFALLEEEVVGCEHPWPLIEGMLLARDRTHAARALEIAVRRANDGSLKLGTKALDFLAEQVENQDSFLALPSALAPITALLRSQRSRGQRGQSFLTAHYLRSESRRVRRLAARLLDVDGQAVSARLAAQLLGAEPYAFLKPYLDYTRACHLDLLHIAPEPGQPPPALASLRRAELVCGQPILKDIIAQIGWPRLNLGIEIEHYYGISMGGSLPLLVHPWEASTFESFENSRRVFENFLATAHGGLPSMQSEAAESMDPVARFRSYNLVHAEILSEILQVAPLSVARIHRILAGMDRIVDDFCALFSLFSEETAILPEVYADLKHQVVTELGPAEPEVTISAELTRLVLTFEDPDSLGAVSTLHGLKRYLHQRGLRLGFRLVGAGRATNRTVNLVVASSKRVLRSMGEIHYVDFEPEAQGSGSAPALPYPVSLVASAFGRQLLLGQERFPSVRIFCYGNEVHYYLTFANHPAFLRVDYSPPPQGGMIDLEYYGVSKYDLALHPNPELTAIQHFFRRLDFDIGVDTTRVHARYDKERTIDLGELCEKAEALFSLAPFLMDVDWVIGDLNLSLEARRKVAEAWADRFAVWETLPIAQILTKDRQGILIGVESGAAGEREIAWDGQGSYCDRFHSPLPAEIFERLGEFMHGLGLAVGQSEPAGGLQTLGQMAIERRLLRPIRVAAASELEATDAGLRPRPSELFRREHEAEKFAEILDADDAAVEAAAAVARLVTPHERFLHFQTTGTLNGYVVQSAHIALQGETLRLYGLRDAAEMLQLAFFARGEDLHLRRDNETSPWQTNGSCSVQQLASLLRRANYLAPGSAPPSNELPPPAVGIRANFREKSVHLSSTRQPEERIVIGLRAAPGRATGLVLFGAAKRQPKEFAGRILIAPSVRPEDGAYLFQAAGVVSTGGGVLSHAGLIALQFRKPALIIRGRWQKEADGSLALYYLTTEYREEIRESHGYQVTMRRDIRDREYRLSEGDLVVLDADEGTLHVLGQSLPALTLHEQFQQLAQAGTRLAATTESRDILALRGLRLRALHQIQKVLVRISEPILARHSIRELLIGNTLAEDVCSRSERAELLSLILKNSSCSSLAEGYIPELFQILEMRDEILCRRSQQRIPTSKSLHEILSLRLEMHRRGQILDEIALLLRQWGLASSRSGRNSSARIEDEAKCRIRQLRTDLAASLHRLRAAGSLARETRHLLRRLARVNMVLGLPEKLDETSLNSEKALLASEDAAAVSSMDKCVLDANQCAFSLSPLIGWKAANLAEAERLGGKGTVPPWFVITHKAFELMLDSPAHRNTDKQELRGASTLREAIGAILSRKDLDYAQKSGYITGLWKGATLPREVAQEARAAYRNLGEDVQPAPPVLSDPSQPLVAIRSSALEEDSETAARAGDFDTFLFVKGDSSLLEHIKLAWAGLWTERAIHNRAVIERQAETTGGGVIVQRIVWSRVSGVLHTVNVAEGEMREMVINAGLGLGEGVVSGTVSADHIVVDKTSDVQKGPLRFRYITADKRERVVFNKRQGQGTMHAETLYHQRLRPALEYVELAELVRVAAALEEAYGYPLDIEFAVEGTRLWILQVRPVTLFLSVLRETLERFPMHSQPSN